MQCRSQTENAFIVSIPLTNQIDKMSAVDGDDVDVDGDGDGDDVDVDGDGDGDNDGTVCDGRCGATDNQACVHLVSATCRSARFSSWLTKILFLLFSP